MRKALITQLFRLNIEPRVIDQLARIATRTGEPKTRLARRLFTDAVMAYRPGKAATGRGRGAPAAKNGAKG